MSKIYNSVIRRAKKKLAVLIDPDKTDKYHLDKLVKIACSGAIDFFLVGGSIITKNPEPFVISLKEKTQLPVILFPGSLLQFTPKADAILLLSLISGRNPDLLIGNHVAIAPILKKSQIEVLSTGYMLVNSGNTTSVEYVSNTLPIPANKPDIAVATALAGEMLGLKLIYMDAGSGAEKPISSEVIRQVKQNIQIPLIIGGGLRNTEQVRAACSAGADIIVVGTAAEQDTKKISAFSKIIHSF